MKVFEVKAEHWDCDKSVIVRNYVTHHENDIAKVAAYFKDDYALKDYQLLSVCEVLSVSVSIKPIHEEVKGNEARF